MTRTTTASSVAVALMHARNNVETAEASIEALREEIAEERPAVVRQDLERQLRNWENLATAERANVQRLEAEAATLRGEG